MCHLPRITTNKSTRYHIILKIIEPETKFNRKAKRGNRSSLVVMYFAFNIRNHYTIITVTVLHPAVALAPSKRGITEI